MAARLVLSVVLLLLSPAPARAVEAHVVTQRLDKSTSDSSLVVTDRDGVPDDLALRLEDGALVLTGSPVPVAGTGCTVSRPGEVRCAGASRAEVDLGTGDDRLTVGALATTYPSGIVAGPSLRVHAGPGADQLVTQASSRIQWSGGPGADVASGDATVTSDYQERTAPVSVTYDGVANDGEAGEGDDVGVRGNATGGSGNDRLVAAADGSTLRGGEGDDRLEGGPGPDSLGGDAGNDELTGLAGADGLSGGTGRDLLLGGEGDDALSADSEPGGDDTLDGGPGRDGATVLRSGPGMILGPAGTSADGFGRYAGLEQVSLRSRARSDLLGSDGPDTLTLVAARGSRLEGRGGDDTLTTGSADDEALIVDGGPGRDEVFSGRADDTLRLADREQDTVHCKAGLMTVPRVDRNDVLSGCGAPIVVTRGRLERRRPRMSLLVICPPVGTEPCRGTLDLSLESRDGPPRRVDAHRRIRLRAGQSRRLGFGLRRLGRRGLAGFRSLRSYPPSVRVRTVRQLPGQRSPVIDTRNVDLRRQG